MSANLLHACQQHLYEAGQSGLAQDLREYGANRDELVAALRDMTRIAKAASLGISGNQPRIARAEAALAKAGAA